MHKDPEFSRRVGRATHARSWVARGLAEQRDVLMAVEDALSFEELPEQAQKVILTAERDLRAGRTIDAVDGITV